MSGIMTLCLSAQFILIKTLWAGALIILILWMKKPRFREGEAMNQGEVDNN